MKLSALLVVYVLSSGLAFAAAQDSAPSDTIAKCQAGKPIEKNVVIAKSVDGDTVHIQAKSGIYSVRMLGIDTPETHFMGKSQGEWGEKAADRNKELLPVGTKVSLEFSSEPCDMHGRLLAFVFRGKSNINLQLAKEGFAANYCVAPTFAHCKEIGDAAHAALREREGMFSDPSVELPYDFRRRVKGNEQRSYVGNIDTKEVMSPGNQNSVPMGARVFFFKAEDIKPPFRLAY